MAIQFRIPVESYIITALKAHKASTSLSTQGFIESELIRRHRNGNFSEILGESEQRNSVLAPPTNSTRVLVRLSDAGVLSALNQYCAVLKRTQPQILYTLLKDVVAEMEIDAEVSAPKKAG